MGWKESGLERIGWGSFPHVCLNDFLMIHHKLDKAERLTLRILIIFGEVSIQYLMKRLQEFHPIKGNQKERAISNLLNIQRQLRNFYTLHIDEHCAKATLLYSMFSDGDHKLDSKKLLNGYLMRKKERGGKELSEIYKTPPYSGTAIFGISELKYYRSRIDGE